MTLPEGVSAEAEPFFSLDPLVEPFNVVLKVLRVEVPENPSDSHVQLFGGELLPRVYEDAQVLDFLPERET